MVSKFLKSNFLTLIFVGVAVILYFSIRYFFINSPSIYSALESEALKINSKTPIQIDEETRLDSAGVTGERSFDYYYTLIYKSDSVNKDTVTKYVKPLIVAKLKNNPEMNYFRENDITLNYHYFGYDSLPAVSIEIKPELYKN